jgi:hypothetical protein
MNSIGTTIQPTYNPLLAGTNPAPSQSSESTGGFNQVLNDSMGNNASAPIQSASSKADPAPQTIQLQFDTNPGPFYGRPIAPEGASEIGQWSVLPDGSYFSISDVDANGVATLHAPPSGWQTTPTGQTLTSPAGIGDSVGDVTSASSVVVSPAVVTQAAATEPASKVEIAPPSAQTAPAVQALTSPVAADSSAAPAPTSLEAQLTGLTTSLLADVGSSSRTDAQIQQLLAGLFTQGS